MAAAWPPLLAKLMARQTKRRHIPAHRILNNYSLKWEYLNFKCITRLTESNDNVSLNNNRCTPVVFSSFFLPIR